MISRRRRASGSRHTQSTVGVGRGGTGWGWAPVRSIFSRLGSEPRTTLNLKIPPEPLQNRSEPLEPFRGPEVLEGLAWRFMVLEVLEVLRVESHVEVEPVFACRRRGIARGDHTRCGIGRIVLRRVRLLVVAHLSSTSQQGWIVLVP